MFKCLQTIGCWQWGIDVLYTALYASTIDVSLNATGKGWQILWSGNQDLLHSISVSLSPSLFLCFLSLNDDKLSKKWQKCWKLVSHHSIITLFERKKNIQQKKTHNPRQTPIAFCHCVKVSRVHLSTYSTQMLFYHWISFVLYCHAASAMMFGCVLLYVLG